MTRAARAALALALLAPLARADELTEDSTALRDERLKPMKQVRAALEHPLAPPARVAEPGGLAATLARLQERQLRLEAPVQRLMDLRYHGYDDLSEIDGERTRLRREVEAGGDAFHEDLDRLEELKEAAIAERFTRVAARGLRRETAPDFQEALLLSHEGSRYVDFEGRLRAALTFDAKFYAERQAEIDLARRDRQARRTATGLVGGAALIVAAGVLLVLRRR